MNSPSYTISPSFNVLLPFTGDTSSISPFNSSDVSSPVVPPVYELSKSSSVGLFSSL